MQALVVCGWLPVEWSKRKCCLPCDSERIVVRTDRALDHDEVARLLERAGIPPLEFITAWERVCQYGILDLTNPVTGIRRRVQ